MKILSVFLIAALLCISARGQDIANSNPAVPRGRDSTPAASGASEVRLRDGSVEVGASAGWACGGQIFGTSRSHQFAMGSATVGKVFTGELLRKSPLAGNVEVLGELAGGYQLHPRDAGLGALDLLLRYNLLPKGRWVPFVDVGAGVMLTDIGTPDLSTAFQFNEKAGVGTRYFLNDRWALSLEAQLLHISNASIHSPNLGVNTFPVLLGINCVF